METKATSIGASSAQAREAASTAEGGVSTPASPPTPVEISPPQMVAVRRRSRRRRRNRADKNDTPQRKAYVVLLGVVFVLMAMVIIKPVRKAVYDGLHSISPALARAGVGFETIALVLAGLILLYLMPGMEERVLRLFGINRPKR